MIPLHDRFFDRVNRLPGGMKFLIDMRVDLLSLIAKHRTLADPHISALSDALCNKLQEWLIGFLTLERITWNSPAIVLEKISQYEAVHAVLDWQDLKRPSRLWLLLSPHACRAAGFSTGRAGTGDVDKRTGAAILNDTTPRWMSKDTARCAVFYSITTQRGLSGIDLGAFLIKRVVRDLQNEFPKCETFCTLSPIPGFRKWLTGDGTALAKSEVDALGGIAGVAGGEALMVCDYGRRLFE
ncbi:malonyl-CoA decarboxylase [Jimgerdemannia flammicorona]|uniref:Malonyl-CoA decarboxylase n=1 Tax=Jimgerdemannia flammicorona TaxID=994334 RepID=A0A433PG48_9FUNG|nr:malonyl-CoA decarboxylase [Jimgerdemannia flammicorona]